MIEKKGIIVLETQIIDNNDRKYQITVVYDLNTEETL